MIIEDYIDGVRCAITDIVHQGRDIKALIEEGATTRNGGPIPATTVRVHIFHYDSVRDAYCELGEIEDGHAQPIKDEWIISENTLPEIMNQAKKLAEKALEQKKERNRIAAEKGL